MMLVFFLISFNYNLLRLAKDTMVITAPNSGAEAIPFIKLWVMLPMAFLMTILFTRLSSKFSREKVFYTLVGIFLAFFALFTFVLYPLRETLHPSVFAQKLSEVLPSGFKGLISIVRNWTFTAFYVMAELWSAIVLTVLFWGFANEVTAVKEAKRFYALFGLGANLAGIVAGRVTIVLSSNVYNPNLFFGTSAWEQSVLFLNLTVIAIGIVILLLFRYLNQKVLSQENLIASKATLPKRSLKDDFSYIMKSKYLIYMAIIVIAYNIAMNLGEVLWKNQVKQLYPNPSDYNIFYAQVTTLMGVVATVVSIFISGNFLRRFSWTINALITPIIFLVTAACFFSGFLIKESYMTMIAGFFGTVPIMLSVFFGSVQYGMSRAAKYTLFDATKEIAFIPLSKESKLKGKASIDGVGSRIGKSGGSIIFHGTLPFFATLSASAPVISVIFLLIVSTWIVAAKALGKQFNLLTSQDEKITIPETQLASESLLSEKPETFS